MNAHAETYELSIYDATPDAVWVGVLIGLAVAVFVAFAAESRKVRNRAVFLGGLSIITVYVLPILRGYYFYGPADSMTHVGIIKDVIRGHSRAVDIVYPLEHLLAIVFYEFLNLPINSALLVATILFPVIFIGSMALLFRAITANPRLQVIGTFSAMFFLPLNLIGMYPYPFPSAQAAFFVPLVLYLFVLWLWNDSIGNVLMLGIGFVGLLLLHPQQMMSLLLLFGVLITADTLARYRIHGSFPTNVGRVYAVYGLMLGLFLAWSVPHDLFTWASNRLLKGVFSPGGPTYVSGKADAVLTITDANLLVFFLKLFGVNLVYFLFTAIFLLFLFKATAGRLSELYDTRSPLDVIDRIHVLLVVSVIPVIGLAALYLVGGDETNQAFRYVGFASVVLTITGAIGFHRLLSVVPAMNRRRASLVVKPIVLLLLLFSLLTIHPSPYLLTGSSHVTESQITGFQNAIEHQERNVFFMETYVGAAVYRYVDYQYGHVYQGDVNSYLEESGYNTVDYHYYNRRLRMVLDRRYVTLTCYGRQVHTEIYDGHRFSARDFEYIGTEPGIDNPIATGCFDLYRVVHPDRP